MPTKRRTSSQKRDLASKRKHSKGRARATRSKRRPTRRRRVNRVELRGITKSERSSKVIVYGKLYSTTCIHCINLEPIWEQLVAHFKKNPKSPSGHVYTEMSVENSQLANGIATINHKYLANSPSKMESPMGFPTIFRIYDGKLEYFNGNRDYNTLLRWFSRGPSSHTNL
jgi:hypothetical protein